MELCLLQSQLPNDTSIKNNGCLVKTLKIHNDSPYTLKHPHKIIGKLLSYCPFVKCIDLCSSNNPVPYLFNLANLQEGVTLNHLEELRVFSTHSLALHNCNRMKSYYLQVCYLFRSSLKHIELVEPLKAYNVGNQRNLSYLGVLALFKKLSYLILHYNTEDKMNALSVYSEVFNAYPKLRSFDYICDGIKNSAAPSLKIHLSLCINKIPIQTYPKSTTNTELKSLSLDLPSLDNYQVKYITNIVPAEQLTKCELFLDHADTFKYWAEDINMCKVKKLAQRLFLAKNLFIRVKQGYVNQINPAKLVHQTESKKQVLQLESLVKFVHALQGDKKFKEYSVKVELDVRNRGNDFQQLSQINTTITKTTLEFHQTIDTKFFSETKHNILTAKFADGETLASKTKTLFVNVASEKHITTVLKFVLKHCQQMKPIIFHVGYSKKELIVTIPERKKLTLFSTPQRVPMTLAIDFTLVSQALLYEIFEITPGFTTLVLKGMKEDNTKDSLLDFIKAKNLTEVLFGFKMEQQFPLFCVKMDFYNSTVKVEDSFYRHIAKDAKTTTGSENETANIPKFTIWHTLIQKTTVNNYGVKVVYFFPPCAPEKSRKSFFGFDSK